MKYQLRDKKSGHVLFEVWTEPGIFVVTDEYRRDRVNFVTSMRTEFVEIKEDEVKEE